MIALAIIMLIAGILVVFFGQPNWAFILIGGALAVIGLLLLLGVLDPNDAEAVLRQ